MLAYLAHIDAWLARGEHVAVATVVRTLGAAPRPVGAKMVVASGGGMAGSVSGGCVEAAVFTACQEALANGQSRLLSFGVADETAWAVGLACGGHIEILVEPALAPHVRAALGTGEPVATATRIAGSGLLGDKLLLWPDGRTEGTLGDTHLAARVRADALPHLARGTSQVLTYAEMSAAFLVESFVPPPELFLVGGVHIAVILAALAKSVGWRTVVVDARATFASAERFAHADEVVVAWPDEALAGRLDARSGVAVLTHDPKVDDPALRVALRSPAHYIGALGSPQTHAKRLTRLAAEGFDAATLARINGPIGLPIGTNTAEAIAVSILAQLVHQG